MSSLERFLDSVSKFVWGPAMLALLVGTGIFLTFRLRGIQFTHLGYALKLALLPRRKEEKAEGDISHFQALMTALAATIGTGNIVGVATAISAGGPGALFWMWITALFGMATKYSEAILAVKYRVVDKNGQMSGGPMYYISRGLGIRWLGTAFAIFGALATFGIGISVQANSVAGAIKSTFGVPLIITAVVLAVLTALVILGGIQSIGKVTSWFVPVMAVFYIVGAVIVLIINYRQLPGAFVSVITHAFTPIAPIGGFAGATVLMAAQKGISRGVFSNESGLGSAPIAAAAAKTDVPARQALVSMTGTFIDTIIVCSLTGLVLLTSGVWTGNLQGVELTKAAFDKELPVVGGYVVAIGIIMFAYSTILGWSYYGERCIEYLFGVKAIFPYRIALIIATGLGAVLQLGVVWLFSDIANALMAIPNLIGLLGLSGVIAAETTGFIQSMREEKSERRKIA